MSQKYSASNFTCALAALAALVLSISPVRAGGIRQIPLTSIAFARTPIVVDGDLSDWPEVRPVPFNPLDAGMITSTSPSIVQLRSRPDTASLRMVYDSKFLYIGIEWTGLQRQTSDSVVDFHVGAGQFSHIQIDTAPGSKAGVVTERIGNDSSSRTVVADGAKSVLVSRDDGSSTQEIRIPWSDLTASRRAPASLTFACDFQWPNLSTAELQIMPNQALHDNTHLTECFLTSLAQLFTASGYLGNPNDWGNLHFTGQNHDNTTQLSPLASGATDTYVSAASGPIPVTGQLQDWNPAQFQTIEALPSFLGSRYSAKIAASYDADQLYIAAHIKSVDGPFNTEPEATQAGFSGGDCLQIRLNDGTHTVNLCGWFDSINKQAALTADGNDLKNPFLLQQGAKEVFLQDADGQGYTQEISVPWKVLPSGTSPKVGDVWKGTFQVWWAGLNPQFTLVAAPALASSGGIAYSYHLPKEADVSVGIFDASGHLIRALVKAAHRRAGLNTDYWDGQDQYGNYVSPGTYIVKGIYHPPITVDPVISIGNPGTPPWPTADGSGDWLSDEMTPQGAATDGTNVYLAAPGSEKGSAIIKVGPDGKRIWGYGEGFSYPRSVAIAVQGQFLYALFSGPEYIHATDGTNQNVPVEQSYMICLDKATGAPAQFSAQKPDFTIMTWPFVDRMAGLWDLRANKTFSPETYGGQARYATDDVGEPTDAIGIAASGSRLYVSMNSENEILVLDSTTGKQVDTITVQHPAGLHAVDSGALLAVSDGKVVTIDPASKAVATVIDHDLVAPAQVTTDSTGNIFVSDWGTSFQVKEFSQQGKLVRAIGTPGGRPWVGKWLPNGMLLPHGVAVTNDDKLWVAEDDTSPSRISVWDTSTGALVRDYIGPTAYGGGGDFWADPTDISTIIAENTFFHVDYAKKTWTPVSTAFRRMSQFEPFDPGAMTGVSSQRVIVHNGKQYYFSSRGGFSVVVFRRDGDAFTPVAAVGDIFWPRSHDGTDIGIFDSNLGTHYINNYFPAFFKGHSNQNFAWTDRNGDGKVQADEMEWVQPASPGPNNSYIPGSVPGLTSYWGYGIGADGSIYGYGRVGGKTVVGRISIQEWLPNGVPVYSAANAKAVVVRPDSDGGVQGVYVDNSDHVYLCRGYGYEGNDKDGIDVYDQNSNPVWGIAETKAQQPDDILANNVIGEFKEPGGIDVLGSWLWHGNFKPYLFTSDGLYISSLLDDTQIGPTATWDESYKNYFQGPDGSAYIVNGGKDTYHINKINGLDQIHEFMGQVTVTAAELQAAQTTAAAVAAAPQPPPLPIVHVAYATTSPKIDGDLSDWRMDGGVSLNGTRGRSAKIALSRDATNLYLAYDVQGARFVNKGTDWRTMFISGDCDDLMLHVGKFQPHFSPAEGDERLLLTIYQGQPVAVLYRPVVPGTASPAHLMATTIDQIVRLTDAHIGYKRSATGYTLEASVPLADLGIDPTEHDVLRGDVGVVYADETGSDRSLRLYYYNQHTSMTADLTTEATLQPAEWGDIEFPLGPNLLKNGDFEDPLTPTPEQGWTTTYSRNGAIASITDGAAYTGSRSLMLQQLTPNNIPPDLFNLPEDQKDTFFRSMNQGSGGGRIEVRQRVAVSPGKQYDIRFHYWTLGFPKASDAPGENRGYSDLQVYLAWNGTQGGTLMLRLDGPTTAWNTCYDDRVNYWNVKGPFIVQPGTSAVDIIIAMNDNATKATPQAYIDDIEMIQAS